MSKLVCKECGYIATVYYGHNNTNGFCEDINEAYYKNSTCKHQFVEIDEDIVLAMSLLLRKGYRTNFSCSGHDTAGYNAGYLYMDEKLEDNLLPVSDWLTIDDSDSETIIRGVDRSYDNEDIDLELRCLMLHEDISNFRSELFKWVISLPSKEVATNE